MGSTGLSDLRLQRQRHLVDMAGTDIKTLLIYTIGTNFTSECQNIKKWSADIWSKQYLDYTDFSIAG